VDQLDIRQIPFSSRSSEFCNLGLKLRFAKQAAGQNTILLVQFGPILLAAVLELIGRRHAIRLTENNDDYNKNEGADVDAQTGQSDPIGHH